MAKPANPKYGTTSVTAPNLGKWLYELNLKFELHETRINELFDMY